MDYSRLPEFREIPGATPWEPEKPPRPAPSLRLVDWLVLALIATMLIVFFFETLPIWFGVGIPGL